MATIDQIKRHYDRLSSRERFALMIAAGTRGDNAERMLLSDTAPKIAFSFLHTMPLADAFDSLTSFHMIQQLGTASSFWMLLRWAEVDQDEPVYEGHSIGDAIELAGRRFLEGRDAFRSVCKEWDVDPETMQGMYGDYDHVLAITEFVLRAVDEDGPILTDLEKTIDAYKSLITRELEKWK
jgi:hypothetical protein